MIYGYARVSTTNQDLAIQIEKLKAAGAEKVFQEKVSAKNITDRPMLQELLQTLKSGDTLIITSLDRLLRSLTDGIGLFELLFQQGITVNVLNFGVVDNSPMGQMIIKMMLIMTELERDAIIERTQAGKEKARLNPNFKEGRPKKYTTIQLEHAAELTKTHSLRQTADLTGISESTIKRHLRKKKAEAIQNSST